MNLKKIEKIIAGGESTRVEFKTSTSHLSGIAETLCGFANHGGGIVIVGVSNTGKIVGQNVTDQTRLEIANMLKQFEPPLQATVNYIDVPDSDKKIIMLETTVSKFGQPYSYAGRSYHRMESSTSVMPQAKYQQLLLDKMQNTFSWENLPAKGIMLKHLDNEEILRTVRIAIQERRLPEAAINCSSKEALLRMELIESDQLLNAAVVLFSNKLGPYYSQCQLRLARFKGTNKKEFLDEKQLNGHAFKIFEEAMMFVNRHIPVAARVVPERPERIEKPLYPTDAVREAVVNAICHRDYSIIGGAISIAIFDDRMEIWSDGRLPSGINLEQLKHTHSSVPRNPLIAGVFYRRGLIEKWGRGTQNIIEECLESHLPEPEFFEQGNAFCAKFYAGRYPKADKSLTVRQQEILSILRNGVELPLRKILVRMENPPSSATIRAELYKLKSSGLIDAAGHGAGAAWFLVKLPPA